MCGVGVCCDVGLAEVGMAMRVEATWRINQTNKQQTKRRGNKRKEETNSNQEDGKQQVKTIGRKLYGENRILIVRYKTN